MEIWTTLRRDPDQLVNWYRERWDRMARADKVEVYESIKAEYNRRPNGADLLFLCRSCYGGIVRFRQSDGCMSTPCGAHAPIHPDAFSRRVREWTRRVAHTEFRLVDFEESLDAALPGDIAYCDPPYSHSQSILYGAQSFSLPRLFNAIARCKDRGVFVALSIDGTKRSGRHHCDLPVPDGLFEREFFVSCGRSMLRRFQMQGQTLEGEIVADRLLLTI
jgi:DNA adenine methylase